jgi:uncharacterized protein
MGQTTNRIVAYDRARALAIIGMIFVNTRTIMSIRAIDPRWMNTLIDFITGRAAVVFVMMAGAGMVMAYDRSSDEKKPLLKKRMLIRAALLYMTGLLLMKVWWADILHYYTAFIIGGVILIEKQTHHLQKLLTIIIAVCIPICALATYESEGGELMGTYLTQEPLPSIVNYFFLGQYYPVFPWFCFFLTGMLLGRLERSPAKWKYQIIFVGSSILLIAVECLSALLNAETTAGQWIDIDAPLWRAFSLSEAFPVGPLFVFSASASGLALIALLRLLPERSPASRHVAPMVAFGRLSLTFYISHILIGHAYYQWVVSHHGMVLSNRIFVFMMVFILAGIGFANLWMRHFQRGPLETALNELMCTFCKPKQAPVQVGPRPTG